jgi:hypothetical protein
MFRKLLAKYGSFHQRLQTRWRCLRLGIHYEKGLILGRHIRIANKTQVVFGHNCKVADDVLLWGGGEQSGSVQVLESEGEPTYLLRLKEGSISARMC